MDTRFQATRSVMGFLAMPLAAALAVSLRLELRLEQYEDCLRRSRVRLKSLAISPPSMPQSPVICSQEQYEVQASAMPADNNFLQPPITG